MGRRLGLRGNDLICFAVIYGFSQDGESKFRGNLDYLTDCMFCSRPTALLSIQKLLSLDLIRKYPLVIDGKKRCYYSTTVVVDEGELIYLEENATGKEPLPNSSKEPLPMTGKEPLPNKYNNNIDKKGENNKSFSPKNKRFVKPTIKQIDEYIKEKDMHFDAERFFDYYESKGWMVGKSPMKDWKAACRTWESQRKHEFKEEQTEESGIVYPDGMDEQKWTNTTYWLCSNCRKIAGKISPMEFVDYKKRCGGDSKLLSCMLKEINSYVELHGQVDISEKLDELLRNHKDNEQETGD
jgi:hypothetical protein